MLRVNVREHFDFKILATKFGSLGQNFFSIEGKLSEKS